MARVKPTTSRTASPARRNGSALEGDVSAAALREENRRLLAELERERAETAAGLEERAALAHVLNAIAASPGNLSAVLSIIADARGTPVRD